MQVDCKVIVFLLLFSKICHFESNDFKYEAKDQSYESDGNFSYENDQLNINEESKGKDKI